LKFEFTQDVIAANLTQNEIRELMGREPLKVGEVTSDGKEAVVAPNVSAPTQSEVPMKANDAIRNLSGRQYQNVMRIVRQFGNGKLNKQQASLMLKSGFGFSDEDVNTFLGIDDSPLTDDEVQQFSMHPDEFLLQELSKIGSKKNEFKVVKSKGVNESFAIELDQLEANVLSILTKEKGNVTPETIAKSLKVDVDDVKNIIKNFIADKVLRVVKSKINVEPTYEVLKPVSELAGDNADIEFKIMYSYEWRLGFNNSDLKTSRPFCKKMVEMSDAGKFWSRADIESLSVRLGYSVFDRVGGWWTMPNGERSEQCRHQWVSNLVTKK